MTKVDDVVMYRRGQKYSGTLHLTTHHIIFTIVPDANNDTKKKPSELWFCYPMIERVDFNRGSALLYEADPNSVDASGNVLNSSSGNRLTNGIAESITNSSLATTASEFTNSLTNGLGFGNVLALNNENREKEDEVNGAMIQLSIKDEGDGVSDRIQTAAEKRQYELESRQRKLCRGASIRIQFRDFNYISFDFKNILKCNDVFESMLRLTCIDSIDKLYAFIYQPIRIETAFNGWEDYDVRKEFERQGLIFDDDISGNESKGTIGCDQWRITTLNKKYELCPSYPRELLVPKNISDTMLGHTVKFRSKNRFPALSYYYRKNGCSIVRCSQPLVGIKQNRSIQDENLLQEVFRTNDLVDGKNLIVDARPLTNAMAQVALGAGTEIMDNYGENNRKVFLNIENIHVMRDSLNKVKLLLRNSDVNGCNVPLNQEALAKSGWLEHISKLLRATELLVKHLVYEGVHLVVHCSDGWDRTSQVCSLVELCVDPYYRTLDGFIVLVEKEWVSFGHRFNERCGHMQRESKFYNNTEEGNFQKIRNLNQRFKHQQNMKFESPIFQQFLDCVYQIMLQYPTKFEFNERFLRRLVYHLYSCQYGTFVMDREQEKYGLQLPERTRSVWDYFKSRRPEFTNGDYVAPAAAAAAGDDYESDVLDIDYGAVVWWNEIFCRDMARSS